jgi:hypothetical protein
MRTSSILTATVAGVAITLATPAAHATKLELFNRYAADSAPVVSESGYVMEGTTNGEPGSYLQVSVKAVDNSLPADGECEPASVHAVLTVAPRETFTISTTGELCGIVGDGSPALTASFGDLQTTYSGTAHKRARVVGEATIKSRTSWFGASGAVEGLSVRW